MENIFLRYSTACEPGISEGILRIHLEPNDNSGGIHFLVVRNIHI